MTTQHAEQGTAVVVDVAPRKHTRLITIDCPFCGCLHTHGWPYDAAEPGHRVAHCTGLTGHGYRIPTPADEPA